MRVGLTSTFHSRKKKSYSRAQLARPNCPAFPLGMQILVEHQSFHVVNWKCLMRILPVHEYQKDRGSKGQHLPIGPWKVLQKLLFGWQIVVTRINEFGEEAGANPENQPTNWVHRNAADWYRTCQHWISARLIPARR
jgi:hypothetical protein